jgi:predicted NAD/FAD-dependent oxidoreductase
MSAHVPVPRVAVIGAGLAGAACAASLRQAGWQVQVFDKSRGVGGRMATRRAAWAGADGTAESADFDHGAQLISARQPRFKAWLARQAAQGVLLPWQARVHAAWPLPQRRSGWVAAPQMPALSRHLLAGLPQQLGQAVQRLQRSAEGWQLVLADGAVHGPFVQVMLALPPVQAAVLLAGHHDAWADALVATPMAPCWTLMAETNDVDWPWDAAEPTHGPLAWVTRQDRKPGRSASPGRARWVVQARADWSQAHLEDTPEQVSAALQQALAALLPSPRAGRSAGAADLTWHHSAVHRWRYARPAAAAADDRCCWWDADSGLGVCGDFLGTGAAGHGPAQGVEAAWTSGDELADTLLAALDPETALPAAPAEPPAAATAPARRRPQLAVHTGRRPAAPAPAEPAPATERSPLAA